MNEDDIVYDEEEVVIELISDQDRVEIEKEMDKAEERIKARLNQEIANLEAEIDEYRDELTELDRRRDLILNHIGSAQIQIAIREAEIEGKPIPEEWKDDR